MNPAGPGVVVHVHDNDAEHLTAVLRNVSNLVRDLDGEAPIDVVAHGAGLDLVLSTAEWVDEVTSLQTTGVVTLVACANSLSSRGLTAEALIPQAQVAPSGVGYLVRRQWQGWVYLHP